jgi:hypothetical protein
LQFSEASNHKKELNGVTEMGGIDSIAWLGLLLASISFAIQLAILQRYELIAAFSTGMAILFAQILRGRSEM